jgi:hypothetical protein
MGRWQIGAAVLIAVTSLTSPAIGDAPPVPQEASGTWSTGAGSVDAATGTAVASYPFELPPGRGITQPSLGLAYRHTGGVGEAGEGWSLGLPVITRRGIGGGPPTFQNDHFELSGQPLVFDCDTQCDAATVPSWASGWKRYRGRAEHAAMRLYMKADESTWRLVLPQGGFAEFGFRALDGAGDGVDWAKNAPGARIIYRWKLVMLSEIGMSGGLNNPVMFNWKHLDGLQASQEVSMLTDVFYTPRPGYSLTDFASYAHHVRLEYDRWRSSTYLASPPIWNRLPEWRLRTVAIASRGFNPDGARERVRMYRLRYAPEMIRRHPVLESVAMEGRCASPVAETTVGHDLALPDDACPGPLPPTTFEYTPELGRINPVTGIYEGIQETSIRFVDENDEPIAAPIFEWEALEDGKLTLVDVNKDGAPDVFAFRGGSPLPDGGLADGFVFINPGDATTATVTTFKRAPVAGSAGSLGNDRLAVFGGWDAPTGTSALRMAAATFLFRPAGANPAAFPWQRREIARDAAPSSSWHLTDTSIGSEPDPRNPHVFGDFDGDGTMDALYVDLGVDATANADDVVRLALSKRGQTRFAAPGEVTGLFLAKDSRGPTFWTLADMNGDSLPDYVTLKDPRLGVSPLVYIPRNASFEATNGRPFGCDATASGCAAATASPAFNPYTGDALKEVPLDSVPPYASGQTDKLLVHDVTGDGLADILSLHDSNDRVDVTLFVNIDGASFSLPHTHTVYKGNDPVSASRPLLADMDGNGADDLVLFGNNAAVAIDFQSNARAGLLVKINHATGATTTFTYERLIDQEKRSLDRWNTEIGPWTSHSPLPMHVVTSVSTLSGAPSPYSFSSTVNYSYRDPVFDRWRGRHAGFRRTRVTKGPLETETQYIFGACLPEDRTDVSTATCPSQEGDKDLVLAGLPFIVEQRSRSSGAYASTTVYSYAVSGVPGASGANLAYPSESEHMVVRSLELFPPNSRRPDDGECSVAGDAVYAGRADSRERRALAIAPVHQRTLATARCLERRPGRFSKRKPHRPADQDDDHVARADAILGEAASPGNGHRRLRGFRNARAARP